MAAFSKLVCALEASYQRLPHTDVVWVAVSGGVDSVALLHGLFSLSESEKNKQKKFPELRVLHINHCLRGAESDGDARFVSGLARDLGLKVDIRKIDWQGERPSQTKAREFRQKVFQEILGPKDRIALGHHAGDQTETILLRLLRGTGVKGLGGIAEQKGPKWRPLLGLERAQIQSALIERSLTWREDSSNRSTKYERNWVRLELLPLLEARRPGFSRRIATLGAEVQELWPEAEVMISGQSGPQVAENSFAKMGASELGWALDPREFLGQADAFSHFSERGLARFFRLETRWGKQVKELLTRGKGSIASPELHFELSQNWFLVIRRENLPEWKKRSELRVREGFAESILGVWSIAEGQKIAARKNGDGHQLKRLLMERRVPRFLRAAVPIVFESGAPLGILGEGKLHSRFELSAMGRSILRAPQKEKGPKQD